MDDMSVMKQAGGKHSVDLMGAREQILECLVGTVTRELQGWNGGSVWFYESKAVPGRRRSDELAPVAPYGCPPCATPQPICQPNPLVSD